MHIYTCNACLVLAMRVKINLRQSPNLNITSQPLLFSDKVIYMNCIVNKELTIMYFIM